MKIKCSMTVFPTIIGVDNWGYEVMRVTNSTLVEPGQKLTKADIDHLIETGWTVTIQQPKWHS